jgi:AcrR family transcriptional regulator
MDIKELNTEQAILEAAEAEFLEKGYGNAKMMAIARRAGVSHSMLHYYFRSKENMFQMIFRQKVQALSHILEGVSAQRLSFTETVRLFVEGQFNLIAQNPQLPRFIFNEIVSNKENFNLLLEVVRPKLEPILGRLEKMLYVEIAKGAVHPIRFRDFIMNIVALNVSTFMSLPVVENIFPNMNGQIKETYFNERRESNVQFILNALRP